ncbi:ETC complex I subunit [Neorickettsia risticii]|uniref:NADH:ubiquinone oxidoreductase 18 kDa subunit n=1 Tax=Neorickettsia risticii (strain Illinois) TaxID=434131 RepID=C6V4N4_NEORI|nr:ETC complex I subunit [Neorickettsia risticii]ACT69359.1 NADH:ubiquinone oxidoreductase 18 kda subunit [Neorickettsia risticii str. Illinois]
MSIENKKAIIYRPSKAATQSGYGGQKWVLKFCSDEPKYVEPLMGWVGSRDTITQLVLKFNSREAAEAYAKKNGIDYTVIMPQQAKVKPKSYADNFQ